jgi:hypothetical protein
MNYLEPVASILGEEEFSKLKEMQDEIFDAWNKNQIFRTETEARFAVLNDFKFPTKASKYWQSVREQVCHFNELVNLSFEIRRKRIDLREIEEKLESASGYDKERLEIDRDEIVYTLANADRVAKDRVREVQQWSQLKKEVNDGSFDDKNVNTHQRESLFKSVLNRKALEKKSASTDEKLSVNGILEMLKKEDVNKEIAAKLLRKD